MNQHGFPNTRRKANTKTWKSSHVSSSTSQIVWAPGETVPTVRRGRLPSMACARTTPLRVGGDNRWPGWIRGRYGDMGGEDGGHGTWFFKPNNGKNNETHQETGHTRKSNTCTHGMELFLFMCVGRRCTVGVELASLAKNKAPLSAMM